MKIISWNVNGLQGILKKTESGKESKPTHKSVLSSLIRTHEPDILCLQEIRCSSAFDPSPYLFGHIYTNHSKIRKGYSGTLICTKTKPLSVTYDFTSITDEKELNSEGRVITLEYKSFYLVNAYCPNSGSSRLSYRVNQWETTLLSYIQYLQKTKPVIIIGDLNIVPSNLDLFRPMDIPGTTKEEKECFANLLAKADLIDTYRELYPEGRKYTWHPSYLFKSRLGVRLDFALISLTLVEYLIDSNTIHTPGSDHVPIILQLSIKD